jgi:hypothetical protein
MSKRGKCWLCGQVGELTDDHTQPQCAFNERKRRHIRLKSPVDQKNFSKAHIQPSAPPSASLLRNIYEEIRPDRPIAGGIYVKRQCKECNGRLGRLYDIHFGQWCRDALSNLKSGDLVVIQQVYSQRCRYPLSILKRITAMFFAINGEEFASHQPELSRFARFPDSHELPENVGLYAAYNINDLVSHIPFQARKNVRTGFQALLSQIAHPPFVYVMTLDGPCPDPQLTNLRRFAEYEYGDEADLEATFRILPTNSCFAGDYRPAGKLLPADILVMTPKLEPSFFRLVDTVV